MESGAGFRFGEAGGGRCVVVVVGGVGREVGGEADGLTSPFGCSAW